MYLLIMVFEEIEINGVFYVTKKTTAHQENNHTGCRFSRPEYRVPHYAVNKGVSALAVNLIVIKGADVAVTVSEGQVP
jgi:hypothetical protein